MKLDGLWALVRQNIGRSKKNFVMSGIGIVVGISTFVFFVGLGEGIRDVVLGEIFLVDQVEVVPRSFDTGLGFGGSGRVLDDAAVAELAAVEGVRAVYPKMKFTFPASGVGGKALFGRDLRAEIIADGIEPALVGDELKDPSAFRDLAAERPCAGADGCLEGELCQGGRCVGQPCAYDDRTYLDVCPGDSYCVEDTGACEQPIPFLVSNHLLELYNGSLATALAGSSTKMPKLNPSMVEGFQINLTLGRSFLGASRNARPITRRVRLVGFSDKAITVGVTLPLAYVKRFNEKLAGVEAASAYHSVVMRVDDQTRVPEVVGAVRGMGFELAESTESAEQAARIILTVQSVFALIAFIIVGIAAVNISQMFYTLIYQRRREIGVLRAVGASRGDVRRLILAEAALLGLIGGALGALAGFGAAMGADAIAARLPEFPFKPETFFAFPWWLWAAAVAVAVVFCLFGAFFPANAAARQEPAAALTQ